MKLATIRTDAGTRAARVDDDGYVALDAPDVGALLARGEGGLAAVATARGTRHPLDDTSLAPVVPRPGKILCQGLNYRNHILEMAHELPDYPTLFAKVTDALIGARDDIWLPSASRQVDWEAELTFVIGRPVRHASAAEAAAAIAGFTVGNDVSMRDWQNRSLEWLQGKTWEHASPVGPWLVTPDEAGGVEPDLEIRCEVDGVVRQDSRTSELVFSAVDLVAYASEIVTLHPGDVIFTGTPGGVGHAMRPPVYLEHGQVVRTSIERVGELVNRCVAEPTG